MKRKIMVQLLFIGTSNAFGHGGRLTSSYMIKGSKNILLDGGPSLLSGLKKNNLTLLDIDMIAISHLHPDHFLGIPQLALENYYVIKKKDPITIIGPPGSKNKIIELTELMYDSDISNHINELFKFVEFEHYNSKLIEDISFSSLPAIHTGNARMLKIMIDGKIIGYTGDTSYLKNSFNELLKSDVMITEASSAGFSIPDHMSLEDVLSLKVPENCKVYLSHLGQSVIDKASEIKSPFFLSEDNLTIEI